jgi:hypothetical protein
MFLHTLISELTIFNNHKILVGNLQVLISYFLKYYNLMYFVLDNKVKSKIYDNWSVQQQKVTNLIFLVFKSSTQICRRNIIYYLEYAIYEINKKSNAVKIYVNKEINEENVKLIKKYILQVLDIKTQTIIKSETMQSGVVMCIKFRNYTMKYSLRELILKEFQVYPKLEFWKFIQSK